MHVAGAAHLAALNDPLQHSDHLARRRITMRRRASDRVHEPARTCVRHADHQAGLVGVEVGAERRLDCDARRVGHASRGAQTGLEARAEHSPDP